MLKAVSVSIAGVIEAHIGNMEVAQREGLAFIKGHEFDG